MQSLSASLQRIDNLLSRRHKRFGYLVKVGGSEDRKTILVTARLTVRIHYAILQRVHLVTNVYRVSIVLFDDN